jgi:hypothetical protein
MPLAAIEGQPNEAMHRMSGHHVSSIFGRPGRPLIGDLDRSEALARESLAAQLSI